MFEEKSFQVALFISLLVHAVVLSQVPQLNLNINKSLKQLEVTYQRIENLPKELKISSQKSQNYRQGAQDKIYIVKTQSAFQDFVKENFQLKKFIAIQNKPKLAKVSVQKKRSVDSTLESKIDNPFYKSYYQSIRDRIKRQAYKNYTNYEEGEVYLSFIIASDGSLKDINFFKDKSSPSVSLQQIAVKSVKGAAPYPKFPADLTFPELSFNVIISFEVND